MLVLPPNGLQISCRRSCRRPHQPTLPLLGREERGAHWELWPAPACRLRLRVRRHASAIPPGDLAADPRSPGAALTARILWAVGFASATGIPAFQMRGLTQIANGADEDDHKATNQDHRHPFRHL